MTCKKYLFAGIAATLAVAIPATANAAPQLVKNPAVASDVQLISTGKSTKIDLKSPISDIIVGNPDIADVQVRSPRQIWIFGKNPGDTTVSATDSSGRVIFQQTIRVAANVDSIDEVFKLAMPDADINITPMSGGYMLTGSVKSADDIAKATEIANFYSNSKFMNLLKTATPYQVNLQVRIAEVSRTLAKEIASNLTMQDANPNGFLFGIGRGRQSSITNVNIGALPLANACTRFSLPESCGLILPFNPATGEFVTNNTKVTFPPNGSNILNLAGSLFGLDVAAAFDLAERSGLATTLAQPNLTTMSGESAEFQAGGSFPIPVSDNFGSISVQQQNYGIQLTYTPTVLSDGRIRLQVAPEVSDITSNGAVRINGTEIPALLTRRASTTVELGSGQSFMIAGLLSNSANSSVDKYPGLGDVPVLGALFKSNGWRKQQTELVIVITPYLVKPVSESEIMLPTDGFNAPNDLERILLNKQSTSTGMTDRPRPTVAPEAAKGPEMVSVSQEPAPISKKASQANAQASAPGFSFD